MDMVQTTPEFEEAMMSIYVRALKECGYRATVYHRMLQDHGGLGTAQRLLSANQISYGFASLWEAGRLDLTVEYLALDPRWSGLLTADELRVARERLLDHGMQQSRLPS
jgi:hypothetical protein